ncbi:MAG: radical SAM protein [Candidatus Bathyarchaeota archaeon]
MTETLAHETLVKINESTPLVGCIAFGLIDRGTNLIQVRPISTCPLSCLFCSTNAGPKSRIRQAEYIVALDHMVETFRELVRFKGERQIEAHIDTVGDPLTYPHIVELVHELHQTRGVETVSMQTHGVLLNEKLLDELSSAGLSRINLSIDALAPKLAKRLADTKWYDIERITDLANYIVENTTIDLLLSPVWVPDINDQEIPEIIDLASKIGAGRKGIPLGIQKYEVHKHGRKIKGVKAMRWRQFYPKLRAWEKLYKTKLVLHRQDFGIHRRPTLSVPYRRSEKTKLRVIAPGWLRREKMAATMRGDRTMTLINAERIPVGAKVKARIIANKHNIYLAEAI